MKCWISEIRLHIAAAAVAVFLATYWLPLTIDFGLIALTLGATAALHFITGIALSSLALA